MKKLLVLILGVMVLAVPALGLAASPEEVTAAVSTFKKSPAVQEFFNNSYGYAVFPSVGKAGFIIGGTYGSGQVFRAGELTGNSKLIEGSLGFQLGGKAFRQIIFFENKTAYDRFTSGSFEFDATAQATIVTASAEAKAGTTGATAGASAVPTEAAQAKTTYINGMAIFVHSIGGLMYEVSIGGQKFSFEPI